MKSNNCNGNELIIKINKNSLLLKRKNIFYKILSVYRFKK